MKQQRKVKRFIREGIRARRAAGKVLKAKYDGRPYVAEVTDIDGNVYTISGVIRVADGFVYLAHNDYHFLHSGKRFKGYAFAWFILDLEPKHLEAVRTKILFIGNE